jgi:hypothetical protein
MKLFAAAFLILSTLLTVFLIYAYFRWGDCGCRRTEGFAAAAENPDINALFGALKKLKRLGSHFADIGNWKERIEMMKLTPTELARRYIKSQQKAE